jgi:D-alanine-D-alanine ligase
VFEFNSSWVLMKVLVLHSDVAPDAPPDEQDTLYSAEAVAGALERLGHEAPRAAFQPDLAHLKRTIAEHKPEAIFNLVESVFGAGIYSTFAPAMLDRMNIPFTGATAAHFAATTDKPFAKTVLRSGGVETPDWSFGPNWRGLDPERLYIVKAADEDASVGIDEKSVVKGREVRAKVEDRIARFGGRWFAEAYVDGREFNIAVLAGADGPIVFPLAEMCFRPDWPKDRPKLVSFDAKWIEDTYDYNGSERRFGVEADEPALGRAILETTRKVWHLFALRGYGRVDFRIDPDGKPWVLEINPNCCISPDAGFAAAGEQMGLPYDALIGRVLEAALL